MKKKKVIVTHEGYEHAIYFNSDTFKTHVPPIENVIAQENLMMQIAASLAVKNNSKHERETTNRYYLLAIEKKQNAASRYHLTIYDQLFNKIEPQFEVDLKNTETSIATVYPVDEDALTYDEVELIQKAEQLGPTFVSALAAKLVKEFAEGKISLAETAPRPTRKDLTNDYAYTLEKAEQLFNFDSTQLLEKVFSNICLYQNTLRSKFDDLYKTLHEGVRDILQRANLPTDNYDSQELAVYAKALTDTLQLDELKKEIDETLEKDFERFTEQKPALLVKKQIEELYCHHEQYTRDIKYLKRLLAWCIYESARLYFNDVVKNESAQIKEKRIAFNEKFKCVGIELAENAVLSPIQTTYAIFDGLNLEETQEKIRNLLKACETSGIGIGRFKISAYSSSQIKLHEGLQKFDALCKEEFKQLATDQLLDPVAESASVLSRLPSIPFWSRSKGSSENMPYYTSTDKCDFTWGEATLSMIEKIRLLCAPIIEKFVKINTDSSRSTDRDCIFLDEFLNISLLPANPTLESLEKKLRQLIIKLNGKIPEPKRRRLQYADLTLASNPVQSPVAVKSYEVDKTSIKYQFEERIILLRLKRLTDKCQNIMTEGSDKLKKIIASEATIAATVIGIKKAPCKLESSKQIIIREAIEILNNKSRQIAVFARDIQSSLKNDETDVQTVIKNANSLLNLHSISVDVFDALKNQKTDTPNSMGFWLSLLGAENTCIALYEKVIKQCNDIFFQSEAEETLNLLQQNALVIVGRVSLDQSRLATSINDTHEQIKKAHEALTTLQDQAITILQTLQSQDVSQNTIHTRMEILSKTETRREQINFIDTKVQQLEAISKSMMELEAKTRQEKDSLIEKVETFKQQQYSSPVVQRAKQLVNLIHHHYWGEDKVRMGGSRTDNPLIKIPEGINLMRNAIRNFRCPVEKLNENDARELLTLINGIATSRIDYANKLPNVIRYSLFRLRKEPTRTFYEAIMANTLTDWTNTHLGEAAKPARVALARS